MVRDVMPDTPAAKAGLKRGDRVVKMANEEVRNTEKFLQSIAAKKPGDKIALDIMRDGKEEKLTVTLGDWPESIGFAPPPLFRRPAFLGVQTEPMNQELKKRLNVEVDAGAVVTDVVPDSPAAKAGLKRDDVITTFNDHGVKTPIDLHDAVLNAGPGKEVGIQITRGKEKMSVKAMLKEAPFGFVPTRADRPFPYFGEPIIDPAQRIRDLERRVQELEKKLREMEKK